MLSWRIEHPAVIWTTSISEVGRIIQTPRLGETLVKTGDESSDNIFNAFLTLPENFQEEIGSGSLVIELDLDMSKEDEVAFSTSYKLYRLRKNWHEAEAHCKTEAAQLASIHSQWEQTLAERIADGNWVWLGGIKKNHWQWADNSTWGFTKWGSARGGYMQMGPHGQWFGYEHNTDRRYFLCLKTVTLTENGSGSIELDKEQLASFPFRVFFKSQAIGQRALDPSSDEDRRMTGFKLNWFVKDKNGSRLTEKLPPKQEDWKQEVPTPKYELPSLFEMVQLARQLRLQNVTKEVVLEEVIHNKWQEINTFEEDGMCSMGQIQPQKQKEAFAKLVPNVDTNKTEGPPSEEDIKTGYELFHAVIYCPTIVFKLFRFVDQLVSSETSRTIMQTFVHLFQPGQMNDMESFTLAKQFYSVFAKTLHLQHGNVLVGTSTTSQLQAYLPFIPSVSSPDEIKDIFQELGICFK